MAIIDYFPAAVAADENGTFVRNAEAVVYAMADTNLDTPLSLTDLQGVPMQLRASSLGIYPPFRVTSGEMQIVVVSGGVRTPMTSLSVYANAAESAASIASGNAGAAASSAAQAEQERLNAQAAATAAAAAQAAAEAVGDTNDAINANLIATPGTQTRIQLEGTFARGLSVTSAGAVGDGLTDDTAAIHAARDSAATFGASVWFPALTYRTTGLTNDVDGQKWLLEPGATIMGSAVARLVTLSANDAAITGGTVDGATSADVFVAAGVDGALVEDVRFPHPVSAVRVKQATGDPSRVTVRRCKIYDASAHAIWLNWECTGSIVEYNEIHGTAPNANGIWAGNGSENLTIQHNRIYAPGDMGIELWNLCHHSTILDNRVYDAGSMGVSVDKSVAVKVSLNHVVGTVGYGIEAAGMVDGSISENFVYNAGTRGIAINSTDTYSNTDLKITGNHVIDSGESAIHAAGTGGSSDRVQVTYNTIRNTGSTAIKCDPNRGSDWTVDENRIYQEVTSYTAIDISGGYAKINGNKIEYSAAIATAASAAILLASVGYTLVGNKIRGNGKLNVGITCNAGVANTLIDGNHIDGTVQNMVLATSVTALDVTVSNNKGTKSAGNGFNLGTAALGFNNQDGVAGAISTYVGIAGSTLPAAGSAYRGQIRAVRGSAGVADVLYICMKDAADAYSWKPVTLS